MQKNRWTSRVLSLALGFAFLNSPLLAATRNITLVNYETNGVKQWLPGTIVVEEGDTVNLTLINKVPSGIHGFEIADFKQKVEIKKDETKNLSFTADKAGIFPIDCQIHKPHVGGQLVVLKK